ncbi:MAG: hypothetical protein ABSH09_28105 [Bryobacteraceae bacterium]|jgi:hypothetical protein
MNLSMSGLGADKKKVAALCGLLAVAGYFYFSGGSPSDSGSSSSSRPSATGEPALLTSPRVPTRQISRIAQGKSFRNAGEFKPTLKWKKDEMPDRNSIDPTLRLDMLAKLQTVKEEGGSRSIFDFGAAAPAPAAQLAGIKEPAKILMARNFIGPKQPGPPPPPPVPPKAPPVPLKFYGFVNQTKAGVKRAFFLDGDDIIVASEGQLIKNRYKIVRIGINSAVVEDTQFKNDSQQTLPLVEEVTG